MTVTNVNFVAPQLPTPPKGYDQQSFEQFNNVLRIYFNQLDDALRNDMTVPYNQRVAQGDVPGAELVFKFGHNAEVGSSEETIWSEGGLYSYLPSATQLTVSSSDANDTSAGGGGSGARTIQIYGQDANYNEINEVISLTGQTPVTTTLSYLRIYRGIVLTAGSGAKNAGIIRAGTGTVSSGVPANVYMSIDGFGDNQSQMLIWTVPAGYTGYLYQTNISTGNSSNTPAILRTTLVARPFGGVFNVKERITLSDGNQLQNYDFPLVFTEKTDLEFRATSSSGSVDFDVSASVQILYIANSTV